MESKRLTWSQESTLTRRLCSEASPEDMSTGLNGMSTECVGYNDSSNSRQTPRRAADEWITVDEVGKLRLLCWDNFHKPPKCSECRDFFEEYRACPKQKLPVTVWCLPVCLHGLSPQIRAASGLTPDFYRAGINRSLPIGWAESYEHCSYIRLQSTSTHAHASDDGFKDCRKYGNYWLSEAKGQFSKGSQHTRLQCCAELKTKSFVFSACRTHGNGLYQWCFKAHVA